MLISVPSVDNHFRPCLATLDTDSWHTPAIVYRHAAAERALECDKEGAGLESTCLRMTPTRERWTDRQVGSRRVYPRCASCLDREGGAVGGGVGGGGGGRGWSLLIVGGRWQSAAWDGDRQLQVGTTDRGESSTMIGLLHPLEREEGTERLEVGRRRCGQSSALGTGRATVEVAAGRKKRGRPVGRPLLALPADRSR